MKKFIHNENKIKSKRWFYAAISVSIVIILAGLIFYQKIHVKKTSSKDHDEAIHQSHVQESPDYYTCPMHPQVVADKPGKCPICGMTLVPVFREKSSMTKTKRKILYYRNPMNPQITSPTPMKDSMGMDFVPVFESEVHAQTNDLKNSSNDDSDFVVINGVHISTERQQLIGVKRSKVLRQKIHRELRTTGRVAYDPELAIAVREYLSTPGDGILRQAAYSRLRLLGMGEDEIRRLGQNAASYTSLFLPEKGGAVWVYATLYEGDIDKVKTGDSAVIQLPDKNSSEFTGRVHSISVTVDAATRTIHARIYVPGGGGKLLPDTYVNITLYSEKGEGLVIPQSAIVDTGERQIVYVIEDGDQFVPRIVHVGAESGDKVVILRGLKEGDVVVSSAAFLIDSESQLKSPMSTPEHHHD